MKPARRPPARLVELGHLAGATRDGQGQLYLWPEVGIIAPQTRTNDHTWRCELVATDRSCIRMGGDRPQVTDGELAALATTMWADPADAETYAMLWQTRIRQRWCGAHSPAVARVIAEGLRIPGTLTADLDLSAITHLLRQTHTTPEGVRRILARLAGTGHLIHLPSTPDGPFSTGPSAWVALTLPNSGELPSRTSESQDRP